MKTISKIIESWGATVMSVGLDPKFKYSKNEKAPKMSFKDNDSALVAGKEAQAEFDDIINEITDGIKDFYTTGRVKDAVSLARKIKNDKVDLSMIDDLVGYMVVVNTIDDELKIAEKMLKDDRFFRIYDFYNEPKSAGYYGIHGNFVTSKGVIGEIQIITKYQRAAKSLIGHILYEVRREIVKDAKSSKELQSALEKVENCVQEFYDSVKIADKKQGTVDYPNIVLSEDEKEAVKQHTTQKTFNRFLTVLDGTCIKINKKIPDTEKRPFKQLKNIAEKYTPLCDFVNLY